MYKMQVRQPERHDECNLSLGSAIYHNGFTGNKQNREVDRLDRLRLSVHRASLKYAKEITCYMYRSSKRILLMEQSCVFLGLGSFSPKRRCVIMKNEKKLELQDAVLLHFGFNPLLEQHWIHARRQGFPCANKELVLPSYPPLCSVFKFRCTKVHTQKQFQSVSYFWQCASDQNVLTENTLLPHSPAFVGAFLKTGLFYQGNNSEFYSSSAGAIPQPRALLQCWVFPTAHKAGALQLSKQCMYYLNCFTGRRIMCSATPQDNEPKELQNMSLVLEQELCNALLCVCFSLLCNITFTLTFVVPFLCTPASPCFPLHILTVRILRSNQGGTFKAPLLFRTD